MKIGIVGFGREGKAAYDYWHTGENTFVIFDQKNIENPPEQSTVISGENYLEKLVTDKTLDLIVRSPGVPLWSIEGGLQVPVTTLTREFFAKCPAPIIGVTGTKGKGTTATLIYKILEAAGKKVWLLGNIGNPATEVLGKIAPSDYVVYELSSFQLYDLTQSPQIAVCLSVTQDHLDWHKDLSQYQEAKGNIFAHQKEDDVAIYHSHNSESKRLVEKSIAKQKISYGNDGDVQVRDGYFYFKKEKLFSVEEVVLPGAHNIENFCAAIAATYPIVKSVDPICTAAQTFTGLPYHIEKIAEIDGVEMINDSFSTNPSATEVAIVCFTKPIILIVGGVDRGLELDHFAEILSQNRYLKHILLYGQIAQRLGAILKKTNIHHYTVLGSSFDEVIQNARSLATSGEVILFSPGAPSFDMFRDYIERGEKFNKYFK